MGPRRKAALLLVLASIVRCGARSELPIDEVATPSPTFDAGNDSTSAAEASTLDVGNEALDCSQASSESWLTDPCLWQPIPELASCEVYWAKLPSSRFPARSFTECGQGCRFTNGPADGSDGLFRLPRGWFDTRSSYVLLNTFVEEIEIREVVNVTENRTVGAFENRVHSTQGNWAQCIGSFRPLGPVQLESWIHWTGDPYDDHPHSVWYASIDYRLASTPVVVPTAYEYTGFGFDVGEMLTDETWWVYLDGHSQNSLHASNGWSTPPPFPEVTPKSDKGASPGDLTLWGSVFSWHDFATDGGSIHTWSSGKGYAIVAKRSAMIFASAIGEDGIVWMEPGTTTYDPTGLPQFSDFQLWKISDIDSPVPMLVASNLVYPAVPGIVLGGGHATIAGCTTTEPKIPTSDCRLQVVNLSTGHVSELGSPTSDTYWVNPAVIDSRELVVGAYDHDPYFDNSRSTSRWYVLDMAELPHLEEQFAPTSSGNASADASP